MFCKQYDIILRLGTYCQTYFELCSVQRIAFCTCVVEPISSFFRKIVHFRQRKVTFLNILLKYLHLLLMLWIKIQIQWISLYVWQYYFIIFAYAITSLKYVNKSLLKQQFYILTYIDDTIVKQFLFLIYWKTCFRNNFGKKKNENIKALSRNSTINISTYLPIESEY